jgi:hypothetical protein
MTSVRADLRAPIEIYTGKLAETFIVALQRNDVSEIHSLISQAEFPVLAIWLSKYRPKPTPKIDTVSAW